MSFVETAERADLRASVAALAEKYGQDYFRECAREGRKTDQLWTEAGKLGFIGVNLPEAYGGGGAGMYELAIVMEEIAAAGTGLLMLVVGVSMLLPRRGQPDPSVRLTRASAVAEAERASQCSVPKEGGWRPGARWAKSELAAEIEASGEDGSRIAVIGSDREVGTTLSAIALARTLAQSARVVLVDLAFSSPNVEVISSDPSAPGIADLVRGAASFGDIITRDRASRLQLVAAGDVGNDAAELLVSQMLWAAIDALAQSYDYLVLDAGSQTEAALDHVAVCAPCAVLIGGSADPDTLDAIAGELQAQGFGAVSILSGPPPELEEAAQQSAA